MEGLTFDDDFAANRRYLTAMRLYPGEHYSSPKNWSNTLIFEWIYYFNIFVMNIENIRLCRH